MSATLWTRNGTARHNTVQVYLGPSRIDGSPLVVLVTGLKVTKSATVNSKTGPMVQSYILRADMAPLDALRTGADVAQCGGCIHRPQGYDGESWTMRSCYVRVDLAPTGIYKAWKRGNVPTVNLAELAALTAGRMVRLGSYGDPAAIPLEVWDAYTEQALGWTGYTHQARNPKLRDVLRYCQVSADSLDDARAARGAGVGSFRVLPLGVEPEAWEVTCPASEEAGRKTTCDSCKLCSGFEGANVAIQAHGIGARQVKPSKRRGLSLPVINPNRSEVFA